MGRHFLLTARGAITPTLRRVGPTTMRWFHQVCHIATSAFSHGVPPKLTDWTSTGGAYFVNDESGKGICVLKPEDEEPYAINNPKRSGELADEAATAAAAAAAAIPLPVPPTAVAGVSPPPPPPPPLISGSRRRRRKHTLLLESAAAAAAAAAAAPSAAAAVPPGPAPVAQYIRKGILPGEGAAREVAAFLLDHSHRAGVPPTALVLVRHPAMHVSKRYTALSRRAADAAERASVASAAAALREAAHWEAEERAAEHSRRAAAATAAVSRPTGVVGSGHALVSSGRAHGDSGSSSYYRGGSEDRGGEDGGTTMESLSPCVTDEGGSLCSPPLAGASGGELTASSPPSRMLLSQPLQQTMQPFSLSRPGGSSTSGVTGQRSPRHRHYLPGATAADSAAGVRGPADAQPRTVMSVMTVAPKQAGGGGGGGGGRGQQHQFRAPPTASSATDSGFSPTRVAAQSTPPSPAGIPGTLPSASSSIAAATSPLLSHRSRGGGSGGGGGGAGSASRSLLAPSPPLPAAPFSSTSTAATAAVGVAAGSKFSHYYAAASPSSSPPLPAATSLTTPTPMLLLLQGVPPLALNNSRGDGEPTSSSSSSSSIPSSSHHPLQQPRPSPSFGATGTASAACFSGAGGSGAYDFHHHNSPGVVLSSPLLLPIPPRLELMEDLLKLAGVPASSSSTTADSSAVGSAQRAATGTLSPSPPPFQACDSKRNSPIRPFSSSSSLSSHTRICPAAASPLLSAAETHSSRSKPETRGESHSPAKMYASSSSSSSSEYWANPTDPVSSTTMMLMGRDEGDGHPGGMGVVGGGSPYSSVAAAAAAAALTAAPSSSSIVLAVAPSFSLDNRVVVEAPLGSALLDVHGTSAPATAHSASPFLHTDDYDGHGRPLPSIAPGVSGAASVSPSLMLCEAGGGASAGAPSRIIAPGVGEAMQSSLMRRMTTPLPAVPVKRASLQLFVPHYCTAEEASSSLWPTEEVGDRGREGGVES